MFTGVTSLYRKMEHEKIKTLVVKHSGEASPTIWLCYANVKSSSFISLAIDCFHGL
jgi:hypothetical protein